MHPAWAQCIGKHVEVGKHSEGDFLNFSSELRSGGAKSIPLGDPSRSKATYIGSSSALREEPAPGDECISLSGRILPSQAHLSLPDMTLL